MEHTKGNWIAQTPDSPVEKRKIMEECGFCITHGEFTGCPECAVEHLQAIYDKTLKERDDLLEACKRLLKAFDIPLITKHHDFGRVRLNAIQATEQAIASVEAK